MSPNTGCEADLALFSMKDATSSMVISRCLHSEISSAMSRHLRFMSDCSRSTIFLSTSGLLMRLRYPISFRAFLQLVIRIENLRRSSTLSALIGGPVVTRST